MKNISETEVNNMGFGKTIELFGRNGHTYMVHIEKKKRIPDVLFVIVHLQRADERCVSI